MRSLLVPLVLSLSASLNAQSIVLHPAATSNQADYVVIAPAQHIPPIQLLTAYRTNHNGYSTAVVIVDSIYRTFGAGLPADSSIRLFIRYALSAWQDPKPRFFVLAGNTNVIPSHKERGLGPVGSPFEDSICVDLWYVEPASGSPGQTTAAIGRFPAWSLSELESMVAKTIGYEGAEAKSWAARSVALADYQEDVGNVFESFAHRLQTILGEQWKDTITAYVRPGASFSRNRAEFRDLWSQGAAVISLVGMMNWEKFSFDGFFTTWDVDSIADDSPLAFCLLEAGQRYARRDSIPIAVNLLRVPSKGAVATVAPSGMTYAGDHQTFTEEVARQMVKNPRWPVGEVIRSAFEALGPSVGSAERNETLLGDPAVVIKQRTLAGTIPGGAPLPDHVVLHQNFPNPFNPTTTIRYSVPERARVSLTVYNALGQQVARLVDSEVEKGDHEVRFDASGLPSGVYFYRLQAGSTNQVRRLVVMR